MTNKISSFIRFRTDETLVSHYWNSCFILMKLWFHRVGTFISSNETKNASCEGRMNMQTNDNR